MRHIFVIRKNKLIYAGIILILLAGMCFMKNEQDSGFSYYLYEHYPPSVINGAKSFQNTDICTQKMLGQHSIIIYEESINETSVKGTIKTNYVLVFLIFVFLSLRFNAIIKEHKVNIRAVWSAIIVQFIHLKDGKKRMPLLFGNSEQ